MPDDIEIPDATEFAVRRAERTDIEHLLAFMEDFNRLESIAWCRETGKAPLTKLLGHASLGFVAIATVASKPVGYVVLTYGYDLEFGGRDAFLTEVYLAPEARGRGLGKRLLADVEVLARAEGVLALHLLVQPENKPAVRLYRAAGFAASPRALYTKVLEQPA